MCCKRILRLLETSVEMKEVTFATSFGPQTSRTILSAGIYKALLCLLVFLRVSHQR